MLITKKLKARNLISKKMEDYRLEDGSEISVLVNTTLQMLKNPMIDSDLIAVLDTLMNKINELDECDTTYKILNFKFVEVAIILQNAADLYSKKIDILWDIILDFQKRLLISTEKNEKNKELEKIEERKQKYKHRRKTSIHENIKFTNNLSFGYLEDFDYINKEYEPFDLSNEWIKLKIKKSSDDILYANKSFEFLPHDSIYNDTEDYIGRYDQFHSRFLLEDIFFLENHNLLGDDQDWITKMKIDACVVNDFLLEKTIPVNSSQSYSSELQDYITNFFEMHKRHKSHVSSLYLDQIVKASYVCLERLPFNILRDKLRRSSTADSLLDGDLNENCRSLSNSVVNNELQESGINDNFTSLHTTLENRSKSCSQDSAFYEDVEDCNNIEDGELDAPPHLNSQKEESNVLLVETNNITLEENVIQSQSSNVTIETVMTDSVQLLEQTDLSPIEDNSYESPNGEKRKRLKKQWPSFLTVEDEKNVWEETEEIKKKKCKRTSVVSLKKLITGITVSNHDYEKFCFLHYKPEKDEGNKPVYTDNGNIESDCDQLDANSSISSDEDGFTSESEDFNENCDCPDAENEDINSNIVHSSSPVLAANETDSTRIIDEEINQNSIPPVNGRLDNTLLSDISVEQELLQKNIRNWQSFIIPKLKKIENRADFDIHEYSMNLIESTEIGEEKYFKDLVKGSQSEEITRSFIAILQLASTHNVEIKGNVPGEVSNDTFQIKVLNKTKHHKLLESYEAPSEKNIKILSVLQSSSSMSSTYSCTKGPPRKKLKIVNKI